MVSKYFPSRRSVFSLLMFFLCCWFPVNSMAYPVTPTGVKLTNFLDELDVTNKWLPNRMVDWRSGRAVGRYSGALGTHCSTFVAAAAAKLGVYILRPPEQEQLLANAQFFWLRNQGASHGWASVDNHVMAQKIANEGCLVVVAYANPNRHRPGHVAIVRPSSKSAFEINSKGPQIIQAGRKNFNSTTLSNAFRRHQSAFRTQKIIYYAHSTPFCQLLAKQEEGGHSPVKRL